MQDGQGSISEEKIRWEKISSGNTARVVTFSITDTPQNQIFAALNFREFGPFAKFAKIKCSRQFSVYSSSIYNLQHVYRRRLS